MTQIVPNKKDIEQAVSFEPGKLQREAKALFWDAVENSPALRAEDMSVDQIINVTGKIHRMHEWLKDSGFRAWFFNQHHAKIKIAAAAEIAVDTLISVMESTSPKSIGHRVKAAQTLLQLAGMEPPKVKKVEFADKEINEMNEQQLRQYLSKAKNMLIDIEKT